MNVTLQRIEVDHEHELSGAEIEVRVLVEIDGAMEWHRMRVRPNALPGFDASLIVPSDALQTRFLRDQYTMHDICQLVGRELRGQGIPLPHKLAA